MMKLMVMVVAALSTVVGLADGADLAASDKASVRLYISGETAR